MSSVTPIFGDLVDVEQTKGAAREAIDLTPYVTGLRQLLAQPAGTRALPVTPAKELGTATIKKRFNEALGTIRQEYPYAKLTFRKRDPKDKNSVIYVKWQRTGSESNAPNETLSEESTEEESTEEESTEEEENTEEDRSSVAYGADPDAPRQQQKRTRR